jgi:hypothetical protein
MGSKTKSPTPVNTTALLPQQQAANDAAVNKTNAANRLNQTGPDGQTLTYDPVTGAQTVTRGAADQALTDTRNANMQTAGDMAGGLLGQAKNTMANPLDTSGMTGWGSNSTTSGFGAVQGVQDAMMGRLRPDLDRAREAERARLMQSGIDEDSAAYQRAMERRDRAETDASQQALIGAMGEQNTLFNQGLAGNASADAQRARQMQEATALRQLPLTEAQALQGMSGTNTDPKFASYVTSGNYKAPDIIGAAQTDYQSQLDAANAAKAKKSGLFGTLGSAVGAIGGSFLGVPTLGAQLGGSLGSQLGGR